MQAEGFDAESELAVVKWYRADKGYGFIDLRDGRETRFSTQKSFVDIVGWNWFRLERRFASSWTTVRAVGRSCACWMSICPLRRLRRAVPHELLRATAAVRSFVDDGDHRKGQVVRRYPRLRLRRRRRLRSRRLRALFDTFADGRFAARRWPSSDDASARDSEGKGGGRDHNLGQPTLPCRETTRLMFPWTDRARVRQPCSGL